METVRRCFNSNGLPFCFDLCVKAQEQFGPVEIDHWWMDIRGLYGQRGSARSHNRLEILRFSWDAAQADNAIDVAVTQERLLLAALLPAMRSQGSRTIFKDAMLGRAGTSADQLAVLEAMLASNEVSLTSSKFSETTRSRLARVEFPEGTQEIYDAIKSKLMDEPKELLTEGKMDQALQSLSARWKSIQSRFGRRAGNVDKKVVLDGLSYEARTAFHDLYSVAWIALIQGVLRQTDCLSLQTEEFLEFWHTVITSQTGQHVFHGHVLGLHPACGLFLRTATGRRLMGEWLARQHEAAYELLLGGLAVAIDHYWSSLDENQSNRRTAGRRSNVGLNQLEAKQEEADDDALNDI